MRGTYRLVNPGEMEATISMTMKVKDWERLRELTPDEGPGWDLKETITRLISDANKVFYASEKEN